jgi:hypothetical protein
MSVLSHHEDDECEDEDTATSGELVRVGIEECRSGVNECRARRATVAELHDSDDDKHS